MKYLVYEENDHMVQSFTNIVYFVKELHDDETYEVFGKGSFFKPWEERLSHIVIKRNGVKTSVIRGLFIQEFASESEARSHAKNLNTVESVMDS